MIFSQVSSSRFNVRIMSTMLLFILLIPGLNAQNLPLVGTESPRDGGRLFPAAYFTDYLENRKIRDAAQPFWAFTEAEQASYSNYYIESQSILLNYDILAYYGHPLSRNMGILGRYSKEDLKAQLEVTAENYRTVSGGRGVRLAYYIIYGTVWPEGQIGIIRESVLREYIEFALENDILIFLDHQIGRYDPIDSLRRMLPWLRYPNVHLALDPEWRTTRPMQEIGSVTAAEINEAQRVMEEYMIENQISGERLLVIHQFNWRMISSREDVRSDFQRVRLIHCADGFGSPAMKRDSYAYNTQATNMPLKGFKLFYEGMPGAGYDYPLMTPQQVYNLNPRPYVIMYQ